MRSGMALAIAIAALSAGCGSSASPAPPAPGPDKIAFPKGFLFGTATAGFQHDMGCPTLPAAECEDPASDWYAFVTSPEMVADSKNYLSGHKPSQGPGQWELWADDLDRAAKDLGNNAFRLSIEWSRIFPSATDGVEGFDALRAKASAAALAHYHAVLQGARARGIEPLVTLNHYTLPTWIHDGVGCHKDLGKCSPRGWLDRERTVREIAKYAGFCAREFGGEVDLWATLNEPFAIVLPGYLMPSKDRSNPPAVMLEFKAAREVMVALVEAHARMYDAVKAGDAADANGDGTAARVGVVYAMAPVRPRDPDNPLDVRAAENVFYIWNMAYLNGVARGDLDAELTGKPVHRDDLAGRMDYIGINYYTRVTVDGTEQPFLPDLSPLTTFNALTITPWEDYPKGVYEMAMVVRKLGLPSIVTENGTPDPGDEGKAAAYMVPHLVWTSRAIRDGADVRGYFWWTLVDQYEWNQGMNVRMGLFGVDKDDPKKTRVARKGAATYAAIARASEVPADLAARYPAP